MNSTPYLAIIAAIFAILKGMGYLAWPWLWVLCPIWIPISLFIGIMFIVFVGAVTAEIAKRL